MMDIEEHKKSGSSSEMTVDAVETISDNESEPNEKDWDDWVEDEESVQCLFCTETFKPLMQLLHHMQKTHFFDFRLVCSKLGLQFYDRIKLINYIRENTHKGIFCSQDALLGPNSNLEWLKGEKYMTSSFIKVDPLLYRIDELEEADDEKDYVKDSEDTQMHRMVNHIEQLNTEESYLTKISDLKTQLASAENRAAIAEAKYEAAAELIKQYKQFIKEQLVSSFD